MTFIAANFGAKNKENIKKIIVYALIWGAIFFLIDALIVLIFHNQLLRLFVDNEESVQSGYTRLSVIGYLYFIDFTMLFTAAILRGLKRSTYPMITTLMCCSVLRIVLILIVFPLPYFHTVFWLYALFPITWVIATLTNVFALFYVIPKQFKALDNEQQVESIAE